MVHSYLQGRQSSSVHLTNRKFGCRSKKTIQFQLIKSQLMKKLRINFLLAFFAAVKLCIFLMHEKSFQGEKLETGFLVDKKFKKSTFIIFQEIANFWAMLKLTKKTILHFRPKQIETTSKIKNKYYLDFVSNTSNLNLHLHHLIHLS